MLCTLRTSIDYGTKFNTVTPYFTIQGETDVEKAFIESLYGRKGEIQTAGDRIYLNFPTKIPCPS
jgi:hypothetical protein